MSIVQVEEPRGLRGARDRHAPMAMTCGMSPAVLLFLHQLAQNAWDQLLSPELAHKAWDERRAMIAEAAYYLAERRGFKPGHELEDWLAAEAQIDRRR